MTDPNPQISPKKLHIVFRTCCKLDDHLREGLRDSHVCYGSHGWIDRQCEWGDVEIVTIDVPDFLNGFDGEWGDVEIVTIDVPDFLNVKNKFADFKKDFTENYADFKKDFTENYADFKKKDFTENYVDFKKKDFTENYMLRNRKRKIIGMYISHKRIHIIGNTVVLSNEISSYSIGPSGR